jgi:hypothetical protein
VISDQFKRKQWKPHTESFEKSPIATLPGFPIKCQCRKNRESLESFSTTKSRSLCVWKMTSILHHSNVEKHNQTQHIAWFSVLAMLIKTLIAGCLQAHSK